MRRNKARQGRPTLTKVREIVRAQYLWFDYLRVRRHIPGFKELEKRAWAAWQPCLRDLRGLEACQRELRRRVMKLRNEGTQVSLDFNEGGELD